jgi:hypothetical protein
MKEFLNIPGGTHPEPAQGFSSSVKKTSQKKSKKKKGK